MCNTFLFFATKSDIINFFSYRSRVMYNMYVQHLYLKHLDTVIVRFLIAWWKWFSRGMEFRWCSLICNIVQPFLLTAVIVNDSSFLPSFFVELYMLYSCVDTLVVTPLPTNKSISNFLSKVLFYFISLDDNLANCTKWSTVNWA